MNKAKSSAVWDREGCALMFIDYQDHVLAVIFAQDRRVAFIEDAVGDSSKQQHEIAVLRLAHTGAIPNTTVGMIAEWFLDWKLPVANEWRKVAVPYYDEIAALQRAPEYQTPHGFTVKKHT